MKISDLVRDLFDHLRNIDIVPLFHKQQSIDLNVVFVVSNVHCYCSSSIVDDQLSYKDKTFVWMYREKLVTLNNRE